MAKTVELLAKLKKKQMLDKGKMGGAAKATSVDSYMKGKK